MISIHLSIIISRFSNLLFFAQRTSQHRLAKFNLQKYLADENINLLFYGENQKIIWKQIEKSIGGQNTKQIKKSIVPFKSIFDSHWHKTFKHLLLWKQYFQNNQPLFQRTILEIKKLNGIKHFAVSKIPIYLISDNSSKNKEINAWFSWTPKESFIVVEIPHSIKVPNNLFPVSVLAHEFFHLMLRKNKNLFSKIIKITKENKKLFTKLANGMPNRMFLEELLISSFIPEGYLNEKYFNTKIATYTSKPKDLLRWRKFVASKLYQTSKKYINNAQRIDEKYLKNLIEIIKQNTK